MRRLIAFVLFAAACSPTTDSAEAPAAAPDATPPSTLAAMGLQGQDAASGEADALVVLLHGLGSNGLDFAPMAERLSARLPHAAFYFPNAPTPRENGSPRPGFSWYEMAGGQAEQSRIAARDAVLDDIGRIRDALRIEDGRVVIGGFSQGAGTAVFVATCAPRTFELAIGMGGVIDQACPAPGLEAETDIFMVHNAGDPRVPLAWGEAARDMLIERGWTPRLEAYPGDRHWPVDAAIADVEQAVIAALSD